MRFVQSLRSRSIRRNRDRKFACEVLESRQLLAVVTDGGDSGLPGQFRQVVAAEPDGGSITFAANVTTVNLNSQVVLNKSVTVDGALPGNARVVIRNAPNTARVLQVDDSNDTVFRNVTLRNLEITNGRTAADGGGILSHEHLTMDNVRLHNNHVTGEGNDGGAISHGTETRPGGNLIIRNSVLENNSAPDDGGAIDFYNSKDLELTNTIVRSNISGRADLAQAGFVGAIRAIDAVTPALYTPSNIKIINSQILNNEVRGTSTLAVPAPSALGGVLLSAPQAGWSVEIRDSVFSGNKHLLTDGYITDTTSPDGRGGALYIADINTTITNTTFTGNYSYGAGGAMIFSCSDDWATAANPCRLDMDRVTMTGNGFDPTGGNNRSSEAGGIWPISFSATTDVIAKVNVRNSDISGNTATFGGGMLIRQGVEVNITDSTMNGNTANRGGALYSLGIAKNNVVTLDRVTIDGNTATFGGGGIQTRGVASAAAPDRLIVRNSTISNNLSPGDSNASPLAHGAGINSGSASNSFVHVTIEQSTISGNRAGGQGGGIYSYSSSNNLEVIRSTVTLNHSDTDLNGAGYGGGIHLYGGSFGMVLNNSIVSGNTDNTGAAPDIYSISPITATNVFVGTNLGNFLVPGGGNQVGNPGPLNAMLGPLANNGGPTKTHLPLAGSPVINTGSGARPNNKDQRGASPGTVGAATDIGSVEVGATVNPCDFDNDGDCDITDIDTLVQAIVAMSTNPTFDLNNDGSVNLLDVNTWRAQAGALNLPCGSPYLPADFNLDGVVDGTDFGIFNSNKFTPTGRWSRGDANADGVTDGSDFGIFNSNKFTASCPVARPERGAEVASADALASELDSLSSRAWNDALQSQVDGRTVSPAVKESFPGQVSIAMKSLAQSSDGAKETSGSVRAESVVERLSAPAAVTVAAWDSKLPLLGNLENARRPMMVDRVFADLGRSRDKDIVVFN